MREIKFRAWDKDQDRMIYPKIIGLNYERFAWDHSRSWLHNCQEWDGEEGFIDNPQLMQYTGLKDKNGKEIYEGDIVRFLDGSYISTESGIDADEYYEVGAVYWEPEKQGWDIGNRNDVDWIDVWTDVTVIGNIHENPELLQQ